MKSKIILSINSGDALPIYRQIIEQVKAAIASGLLAPADKLPTHRDLARELLIAPLTVKKAYDILEQEELIVSGRGRGTFVAENQKQPVDAAKQELLVRVKGLITQARILGIDPDELLKIIQKHWDTNRKEAK